MRPPLPPFTEASAIEKVRLAEDAWNSREPAKVALAYTPDSQWRNRAEFIHGRAGLLARFEGGPDDAQRLGNRLPVQRLGRAEEIAAAIVFAAIGGSRFMTGHSISVDGGLTA